MRFLTEEDLRLLYRNAPFAEYHIEPGTRLTPGGRQFLNDRGIRVCGERASARPVAVGNAQAAGNAQVAGPLLPAAPTSPASSHELLALRRAQSIFLSTGAELLDCSVVTAGEVFELERVLASAAAGDFTREPECSACTGISAKNAGELLEDCFEVTAFTPSWRRGRRSSGFTGCGASCGVWRQSSPGVGNGQSEPL